MQSDSSTQENKNNIELTDSLNPKHKDFLRPERLEFETDKDYELRRMLNKLYLKQKKKGTMFWISSKPVYENKIFIGVQKNTYNKKETEKVIRAEVDRIKKEMEDKKAQNIQNIQTEQTTNETKETKETNK